MFPQSQFRSHRPRRTLDHLFGDDADLLDVVATVNSGIPTRPPRPLRTDEFAPYEGPRPSGSFMGDAPPPINLSLPPVRPAMPFEVPPLALPPPEPVTLDNIGAPPPGPAPRDYIAEDTAALRAAQSAPMERSRLKSAGVGFLRSGIPGLIGGALQPEMYGEMKRARAVKRAETLLGTDMDLRKARNQDLLLQSQIDENKSQAEARKRPPRPILGRDVMDDGTTIQTELNPETGVFEPSVRDGKPIVLSRPKPAEPMVEMTLSDGRKVMVSPSSALGADATRVGRDERTQTKNDERQGQVSAAQDEFDQLTADEAAAGDEKNRAYAYLAQLKANPNTTQDDINEAQKAAETANVFYRSFGPKKAAAKAKAVRYSGSARPGRQTKTLSPDIESRIRAAAAQRGLDPEIAVERARARQ